MGNGKKIVGLVGSPRPDGLTNRLVASALKGAADAGAETELIQMSEYVVDACRDCLPWVCADNRKCTFNDPNLEYISEKLLACDGLVWGTPVYWGDTTAMVRLLMLKLFRLYARTQAFHGIPAFGIAIAGGTGNGLISGLVPLYHFFRIMWMRGIDPLPVTRFNLENAVSSAEESGKVLASIDKVRFENRDERDFFYDNLPLLSLNAGEECKLLASMTWESLPKENQAKNDGNWARAEIYLLNDQIMESMNEVSLIYDSAFKQYEEMQGPEN
ncbi:MAG: flavodoxin family protein [Dehalococcoidales bacterium]|nr:flavodoxin family protein [Dehalococcoidales bacterium]